MSARENERIVRELFESINTRDAERGAAVIAPNCELIDVPFGEVYHGVDGWRRYHELWTTSFPDGRIEITTLVADDRRVAVEYTGQGTHTGPFRTPTGEVPPTGRRLQLQLSDFLEIESGKVVRSRSYFDSASMMRQLGLLPEPGAAIAR
jgi:steroid delta-isomerase-like uncharacterized protein